MMRPPRGAMRVGRVLEKLGYWWFGRVWHYHVTAAARSPLQSSLHDTVKQDHV